MSTQDLHREYKHWRNYSQVGDVCFVTTTVEAHTPLFTAPDLVRILIDDLNFYRAKHGFGLVAFTIMPDHMHLLLRLGGTGSISKIMEELKRHASREILKVLDREGQENTLRLFASRGPAESQARSVWQRSIRSYSVRSEKSFRIKLDYIHANAPKRGLCETPSDYPYSSARNYELGDHSLITVDPLAW